MEVTESSLASALESFVLMERALGGIDEDGRVTVEIDNADAFAKPLYATLSRMAALREPGCDCMADPEPQADPELALLAHVAAAFDEMGDFAVGRVMRYLSDRYPPEN